MSDTDLELLARYARHHAEDAFAEIVRRHLGLVYSAALRQVRSAQLAEEVAQSVFTSLAREPGRLRPDTILTAWLYQVAHHTAANVVRGEVRRQLREQIATEMNAMNATAADWTHIEPLLDEAMLALDDTDRAAVLLRYFENKSLREVGQALGASENAAQKRLTRAVEQLREFFAKRGVSVGASGLVAVIGTNAVQAVPAGLAVTISTASALAGTILSSSQVFLAMTTTKSKLAVATLVVAVLIPSLVLVHQNIVLRREIAALQHSTLEASQLAEINIRADEDASSKAERQRLQKLHLELLSLRGRVAQLADQLRLQRGGLVGATTKKETSVEATESDSALFSASLTNRVGSGNTLVVGGWPRNGGRHYLLATPTIRAEETLPDGQRLSVDSRFIEAPESFWETIGWGNAKSGSRRSGIAAELTPENLEVLLELLKQTQGAEISNASLATGRDGESVKIGFSMDDDNREPGMVMGIDLRPTICPDGQSVDLALSPLKISANVKLHPSLGDAQAQAQPVAR